MKKIWMAALAATLFVPAFASARMIVGVRPAYRPFVGYRYGFGPYWGGPYWGYPGAIYSAPSTGSVKFDTHEKNASVYVNEGYVGTVGQVKTLHLRPGNYLIQVNEPGRAAFSEKVYVTAGNTVKLRPDLAPLGAPGY